MKVYIAGSFKAEEAKAAARAVLEAVGITCLMSVPADPRGIAGCLGRIADADAVYVVNPGGVIGKSICVDIGYALALGRPVFSLSPIDDPPVAELIEEPVAPEMLCVRVGELGIGWRVGEEGVS